MILPACSRPWTPRIRLWGALLSISVFAAPVLAPAMGQLPNSMFMAEAGPEACRNASLTGRENRRPFVGRSGVFGNTTMESMAALTAHAEAYGLIAISPDPTEPLAPGASRRFELPAVLQSTLFTEPMYRIDVPDDAVSLTIDLGSVLPIGGDIDLYVSREAMPTVANGIVVSDFAALGPTSVERIVINRTTSPALQAGTYYVALAMVTKAVGITGALRITIETGNKGRLQLIQEFLPGHRDLLVRK